MDQQFISPFLLVLQQFSSETISWLTFSCCVIFILSALRVFGVVGLYAYNILATIAANIQVLKVAEFGFSPEPIALGTVIFATVFLVSDIITEHYGKKAAQKGVWLSFTMQIFMTIFMLLTLAHTPLPNDAVHAALEMLFLPSPRLLIASLTAFAISQLFEIHIFYKLQMATDGKMLWLRTNVSSILAALLDNIIFSVIAWVILAPTPVSLKSLVFTYILGTYLARVIVSLMSTPIIYLSYKCLSKND
jgi:uncharacterized integral membrane protein (TIGR00697 family)